MDGTLSTYARSGLRARLLHAAGSSRLGSTCTRPAANLRLFDTAVAELRARIIGAVDDAQGRLSVCKSRRDALKDAIEAERAELEQEARSARRFSRSERRQFCARGGHEDWLVLVPIAGGGGERAGCV